MKTSERVYNYIVDYMTENQYSPSIRDIMEGVGLKSTSTVHSHLCRLELNGKIRFEGVRRIYVEGYKFGKDSRYTEV